MGDLIFRVPPDKKNAPCGATNKKIFFIFMVIFCILPLFFVKPSLALALHIFIDEFSEVEQISEHKENVKREGDTLLLKSKSGAYISMKDSPKCKNYETCLSYKFVDYFKNVGFYVVHSIHWEGGGVIMISEIDGRKYYVYDLPMLSPDNKHIITVPHDIDAGYDENGVFIWRIEGTELIQEFSFVPTGYVWYEFIEWKDNSHIKLKKGLHSSKKLCPESSLMTVPVSLKIEADGWKFYEDLTPDSVDCDVN
jgi:hypothetical protein